MQNHIEVRLRHEKFFKKVCESGIVWGLENNEGFATSESNSYENSEGEPVELICFWSEAAFARSCVKNGWSNYKLVEVSLGDLIENWCVGMSNDGLMVGINFDRNMFGHEVDPIDLILELNKELTILGKEILLRKYNGLSELIAQIESLE
jgi:hypothetical protein